MTALLIDRSSGPSSMLTYGSSLNSCDGSNSSDAPRPTAGAASSIPTASTTSPLQDRLRLTEACPW